MIRVTQLSKEYHQGKASFPALSDVSFSVLDENMVSIVGKSGSGKSTLLHILGGLESANKGEVWIGDTNVTSLNASQLAEFRNKMIGFVFQSFFLEPTYNVYQNVEMPLLISKVPQGERKKRILDSLEMVGLEAKTKNKAFELSGGERQRVSVARAIVNRPAYLFADEPCGNLDSENSAAIISILKNLSHTDTKVILVTHNMEDAAVSERIITLHDGRIKEDVLL